LLLVNFLTNANEQFAPKGPALSQRR
jgi:hypothetical protein